MVKITPIYQSDLFVRQSPSPLDVRFSLVSHDGNCCEKKSFVLEGVVSSVYVGWKVLSWTRVPFLLMYP